jgi:hypothetical protein
VLDDAAVGDALGQLINLGLVNGRAVRSTGTPIGPARDPPLLDGTDPGRAIAIDN